MLADQYFPDLVPMAVLTRSAVNTALAPLAADMLTTPGSGYGKAVGATPPILIPSFRDIFILFLKCIG